jgi:nucleotide-binding universal stress UspA family protein
MPVENQRVAAREVLVPLDGSGAAEAAIPVARRLAGALGLRLRLLRVVPEAGQSSAAEAYLASVAGSELPAETAVLTGDAAEQIASAAVAANALLVLTTLGAGGDPRHLGGVAGRLSRSLARPALFVPVGYAADPPLSGPVLVALHGSAASETAVEPAAELARALGSRITLVQVAPWAEALFANFLGVPPPDADAEIELGTNRYLASLAARLGDDLAADYQTLRGRAASMLVEYAESVGGWLVLASHAHHGPHIWGLGGTTDKVLRAASVPVLIVRVGDAEGRILP